MPRLALCIGTRPQVVKSAALIPALRARWDVVTIDTGQHYDRDLRDTIYEDLQIPAPDLYLGVGPAHPVEQTARMSAAAALALSRLSPDAVVVVGDTNSTLACALAAREAACPVVHVEAGLRSANPAMAEERNRIAVDALSAVLCAPSAQAVAHLRRERLSGVTVQTGDVARDVLLMAQQRLGRRTTTRKEFAFATLHRAELTDQPELLHGVLDALGRLDLPVQLPLHPRTRDRLTSTGLLARLPSHVECCPPLSYLDTVAAIGSASVVITDSGGVQREAYWLGTPCVTVRHETEWTETVALGANRLCPPDRPADLADAVRIARAGTTAWDRNAFGDGHAGAQIASAVTHALSKVSA